MTFRKMLVHTFIHIGLHEPIPFMGVPVSACTGLCVLLSSAIELVYTTDRVTVVDDGGDLRSRKNRSAVVEI